MYMYVSKQDITVAISEIASPKAWMEIIFRFSKVEFVNRDWGRGGGILRKTNRTWV